MTERKDGSTGETSAAVSAFNRHLAHTSPDPIGVEVERAEGPWIHAVGGRRYLDLLSGIGVANLGHTHPEVVRAVENQNRRHHHVMVYGEYVQTEQALYAAELAAATPDPLDRVFFVNSGTEAVEGSLKVARKATGRSGFVAFLGGYHGDTFGALSVSGNELYRAPFKPLLGPVTLAPFGDPVGLAAITTDVAAVIVEPVQGEGGVRIPPDAFLPALAARCRETGVLLIFDEVMTGFGRTGRLFAGEHWGVTPDLLVLAKAIGGGFPLGAFVGSGDLLDTLTQDPPLAHVTTFGGHPVSCAAGRAALRVLQEENLCARAAEVGGRFLESLREALIPIGGIVEIRGLGLFVGIEFDAADLTLAFVNGCRERGLLLGWTLHHDHIVRLTPPLITPEPVLNEAVSVMAGVLAGLVR